MNFFEHQDEARQRTHLLVGLFALAVIAIVVVLYLVAAVVWGQDTDAMGRPVMDWWDPGLFAMVAIGTLSLIGAGSLYKTAKIRQGGHVIAEELGGKLVSGDEKSFEKQQLHNVVEEMAIAAGVPVPSVYVMEDEPGINAFAAGYSVDDAVVGVTSGCLEHLDRDELQGVIAHEFSHILNGDMRLNMHLIGILHGILVISLLGRAILRMTFYTGGTRRRRSGDKDQSQLAFLAIGVALFLIGSIGYFFGLLIRSAVSRQREFLADAAAVQFTRNPDGIAGALKKIGGNFSGSRVFARQAEQDSHLFFGYALNQPFLLGSMLSTHPPLEERIRRIDPSFEGAFPTMEERVDRIYEERDPEQSHLRSKQEAAPGAPVRAGRASDRVGELSPETLVLGAALLEEMDRSVRKTARDPLGAEAILYSLLLDPDSSVRSRQRKVLVRYVEEPVREEIARVEEQVRALDPRFRLPLLDLLMPALRQLSARQSAELLRTLDELIEADERISLFEFCLRKIVQKRLKHLAGDAAHAKAEHRDLRPLARQTGWLLSALARADASSQAEANAAYAAARQHLGLASVPEAPMSVGLNQMNEALHELGQATPAVKRQVLDACEIAVQHDEQVAVAEAELLRLVATMLETPLPPSIRQEQVPAA